MEQPLTKQQKTAIVNKIVERYRKRHSGANPSVGYINERLRGQGQHFHVIASRVPNSASGLELKDFTAQGFKIGVVEHGHKVTMDGETSISNNNIGILSDNPNLQVEMHDKAKMDHNGIAIVDDSQQAQKKWIRGRLQPCFSLKYVWKL